jgi:hypothetical protein
MKTETGGPAFPTVTSREELSAEGYRTIHDRENGMTLRDWFAGQALAGMFSRDTYDPGQATDEQRAALAYRQADAMLKVNG